MNATCQTTLNKNYAFATEFCLRSDLLKKNIYISENMQKFLEEQVLAFTYWQINPSLKT